MAVKANKFFESRPESFVPPLLRHIKLICELSTVCLRETKRSPADAFIFLMGQASLPLVVPPISERWQYCSRCLNTHTALPCLSEEGLHMYICTRTEDSLHS